MSIGIGSHIQAWRLSHGRSVSALAVEAGIEESRLESIEAGSEDPTASMLETLAKTLKIPPAWLFIHPRDVELLFTDGDGDGRDPGHSADPIIEEIIRTATANRELYVLLTALLQRGEPKLWRAAEMNLKSLLKQARQTTVPWESRPPGHFEPPSD